MKRLIKKSYYSERNRQSAIAYIDGNFYEDNNHAKIILKYDKDNEVDIDTDLSIPFAMMHKVDTNNEEHGIYIEPNSLQSITLNELISLIKNKYPNYSIYLNDGEDNHDSYTKLID